MSGGLATRCPACHTVFRVVRDQLRVSSGWVRCGRCSEVFNAGRSLLDLDTGLPWVEPNAAQPGLPQQQPEHDAAAAAAPEPQVEAAPAPAPAPAPTPAPFASPTVAPTVARNPGLPAVFSHRAANTLEQAMSREPQPPANIPADSQLEPEVWRTTPLAAPVAAPLAEPLGAPHSEPSSEPTEVPAAPPQQPQQDPLWRQLDAPEFEPTMPAPTAYEQFADEAAARPSATWTDTSEFNPSDAAAAAPWSPLSPPPNDLEPLPALTAEQRAMAEPHFRPSFVRAADRAKRWRHPRTRAGLAMAAAVAALGLLLQLGIVYRDLAAARAPALKPVLEAACAVFSCTVGPALAINSLVVESSGLVRVDRSNQYRLQVTLRNRAGIPVALPAIDVTLTDTLGAVVARKVLSPAEMGSTISSLAVGQSLTLQATLQNLAQATNGEAGTTTIAGYTVEVFYP